MKLKSIISIIMIAVLAFLAASCSTSEEINGNSKNDNNVSFNSKKASSKSENNPNHYKKLYGKLQRFDNVIDTKDFSWKGEKYTLDSDTTDENYTKSWTGDKGGHIFTNAGYICYSAKEFSYNYDALLWDKQGKLRKDFDTVTKNVSGVYGISEQEALERVQKIIDKYNISATDIKAYPLDKNVLKILARDYMSDEEYEEYIKDDERGAMKRDFTKEDEVYIVTMKPTVGEYILYNNEYDYGRNVSDGSWIYALVRRDKVINLYIGDVFETEKNRRDIDKIITEDEAKDLLAEKFRNNILPDKVVCNSVDITYISVNGGEKLEFIPAYVFEVKYPIANDKENSSDITYVTENILLDAEKGKWVE